MKQYKTEYKGFFRQKSVNVTEGGQTERGADGTHMIESPFINCVMWVDEKVYSGVKEKYLCIHFDGTKGAAQWVRNFLVFPFVVHRPYLPNEPAQNYRVHYGFYEKGWVPVRPGVLSWVGKNLAGCAGVEITGYSRGGAIAAHCAKDIHDIYALRVFVETMGAPKSVDAAGVKAFSDITCMNMIYGSDLVTKVPPFYKRPGRDIPSPGGNPSRPFWDIVGMIKDHMGYWR